MRIELWDVDVPYEVDTFTSADCKELVRIKPNSVKADREDEEYDICLSYDQCLELARVLQFMSNEIKV